MSIDNILQKLINSTCKDHPLYKAWKDQANYYKNFTESIEILNTKLSTDELEDLLHTKIHLGESTFDEAQYYQGVSEIPILCYAIEVGRDTFKYEPKYNGKKNPECSINIQPVNCYYEQKPVKLNNRTVNIEVKCPNLINHWQLEKDEKTLKVKAASRLPDKTIIEEVKNIINNNINKSEYNKAVIEKREDNKLKDYVQSAHAKISPTDENNFNLLVISLSSLKEMDEWYSYIYQLSVGAIFTDSSFIDKETYKNLDCIMLTNIIQGHKINAFVHKLNVWDISSYLNIAIYNNLNNNGSNVEKFLFHNYLVNNIGEYSYDFFNFLEKMDTERKNKIINKDLFDDATEIAINQLFLISKYNSENLKNNEDIIH